MLLLLTSDFCPSTLARPFADSVWAHGSPLPWPVQLTVLYPHPSLPPASSVPLTPLQGRGENQ